MLDDTIDIYKVLRFHKSNAINFSPIQCTILIFNQHQIYHQKFKQPSKPLCLLQQLPFCYQLFKPQLLNQHSRIIQRHRFSLQLNQYRLMQLTNQHQKHRAQHCHSVSFFFINSHFLFCNCIIWFSLNDVYQTHLEEDESDLLKQSILNFCADLVSRVPVFLSTERFT